MDNFILLRGEADMISALFISDRSVRINNEQKIFSYSVVELA